MTAAEWADLSRWLLRVGHPLRRHYRPLLQVQSDGTDADPETRLIHESLLRFQTVDEHLVTLPGRLQGADGDADPLCMLIAMLQVWRTATRDGWVELLGLPTAEDDEPDLTPSARAMLEFSRSDPAYPIRLYNQMDEVIRKYFDPIGMHAPPCLPDIYKLFMTWNAYTIIDSESVNDMLAWRVKQIMEHSPPIRRCSASWTELMREMETSPTA